MNSSVVFLFTAVDCGPAKQVSQAQVSLSGQATTYGTSLRYTCIDGYWFDRDGADLIATCDEKASWSVNGQTNSKSWRQCTGNTFAPFLYKYYRDTTLYTPAHIKSKW